jgi:basic membrane protein A
MIDGGREGALRACREFGVRHIGNVIDWTVRDPQSCVASAVADSGECIVRAVRDHRAGALRTGEVVHIGIEAPEVVRLAMGSALSAAGRAAVAAAAAALASGAIQPAADYDGPEQ